MSRQLDTATLDSAAQHYAAAFLRPDAQSRSGRCIAGPSYVMQDLYNLTYKDEHEHVVKAMRGYMGQATIKEFERLSSNAFKPREERVLHELLASKLAVDPDGAHIPGRIGSTQVIGYRPVGTRLVEVELPESIRYRKRMGLDKSHRITRWKQVPDYWPIYAGETEERLAGSDVPDPLPPGARSLGVGALNTRISNEVALLMCDAAVDNLDEGTGAAVIQGRTGAQPADPDTAVAGTLLFTLVCSDPAFGAAADAAPGGTATASAISDDTSADATGTLGYCRASSSNDGAAPLDDHIDGEAGTSGADFNFNTLSIVSGATVSLTSWTVTQPES